MTTPKNTTEKTTEPQVFIKKHPIRNGKFIGVMTLNRPQALNALSFAMLGMMRTTLRQWRDDGSVVALVLHGVGERAFCSGGDIASVRGLAMNNNADDVLAFFQSEYTGQLELRAFPKPTITYGHGYTMGGGLGIMQACDHRIATQSTIMSMPEVNIGLYPDVAAAKFFGGVPLWLGRFFGMTAAMLNSRDIQDCHLADAILPDDSFDTLLASLSNLDLTGDRDGDTMAIAHLLADLSTDDLPDGNVMAHWDDIRRLCDFPSLAEAIKNMQTYRPDSTISPTISSWMQRCLDTLLAGCPNSAGLWWIMAHEGRLMSIEQILRAEMALSFHMVTEKPDFKEGVRALLIDKDRNPQWSSSWDTVDMKHLQAVWTECCMTDIEFDEIDNKGWAYEQ